MEDTKKKNKKYFWHGMGEEAYISLLGKVASFERRKKRKQKCEIKRFVLDNGNTNVGRNIQKSSDHH